MAAKAKVDRWAVLCPGPSLARYDARAAEAAGVTRIAVNLAGKEVEDYEWFCGLDAGCFNNPMYGPPHPSVGLLVSGRRREFIESGKYKGCPTFAGKEWLAVESIRAREELSHPDTRISEGHWCQWSFTTAIMCAWHLGAKRIDLYGCDMTGGTYVNGMPIGYGEHLWPQQRADLEHVGAWLHKQGVQLHRLGVSS
jgi:hypothetical protein